MTCEEMSHFLDVACRNLRPTTRLMNTAIDACARSSYPTPSSPSRPSSYASSYTSSSMSHRGNEGGNRRRTRKTTREKTRTQMAMDIFRRGTSPWEEEEEEDDDDDDDANNDDGADFLTSTTKMTTATETRRRRRRRRKFGGSLSPNVYTFGAMLACAARDGDVDASMRILGTLEDGDYPDVALNQVIYSTVISACANHCVANDDGSEIDRRGSTRMSDDDIVGLALEVLNRGNKMLSGRGGVQRRHIDHGTHGSVEDGRAVAGRDDTAFFLVVVVDCYIDPSNFFIRFLLVVVIIIFVITKDQPEFPADGNHPR